MDIHLIPDTKEELITSVFEPCFREIEINFHSFHPQEHLADKVRSMPSAFDFVRVVEPYLSQTLVECLAAEHKQDRQYSELELLAAAGTAARRWAQQSTYFERTNGNTIPAPQPSKPGFWNFFSPKKRGETAVRARRGKVTAESTLRQYQARYQETLFNAVSALLVTESSVRSMLKPEEIRVSLHDERQVQMRIEQALKIAEHYSMTFIPLANEVQGNTLPRSYVERYQIKWLYGYAAVASMVEGLMVDVNFEHFCNIVKKYDPFIEQSLAESSMGMTLRKTTNDFLLQKLEPRLRSHALRVMDSLITKQTPASWIEQLAKTETRPHDTSDEEVERLARELGFGEPSTKEERPSRKAGLNLARPAPAQQPTRLDRVYLTASRMGYEPNTVEEVCALHRRIKDDTGIGNGGTAQIITELQDFSVRVKAETTVLPIDEAVRNAAVEQEHSWKIRYGTAAPKLVAIAQRYWANDPVMAAATAVERELASTKAEPTLNDYFDKICPKGEEVKFLVQHCTEMYTRIEPTPMDAQAAAERTAKIAVKLMNASMKENVFDPTDYQQRISGLLEKLSPKGGGDMGMTLAWQGAYNQAWYSVYKQYKEQILPKAQKAEQRAVLTSVVGMLQKIHTRYSELAVGTSFVKG